MKKGIFCFIALCVLMGCDQKPKEVAMSGNPYPRQYGSEMG